MAKIINVFIGRLEPPHKAHLQIIRRALDPSKYDEAPDVIICLGSAFKPRTPRDPFTWEERADMITAAFTEEENLRIHTVGIPDSLYNNTQWAREVQNAVNGIVDVIQYHTDGSDDPIVRLVGHKKDDSSFYLDMFPQWDPVDISNIDNLNATTIRDYYFNDKWRSDIDVFKAMCEDHLHPTTFEWLLKFRETEAFDFLRDEFSYIERYKASWAKAPYAPTFVTCDAVVIQSGHILLVKRRAAPGRGLWALPGGFLNPEEQILDGVIREKS